MESNQERILTSAAELAIQKYVSQWLFKIGSAVIAMIALIGGVVGWAVATLATDAGKKQAIDAFASAQGVARSELDDVLKDLNELKARSDEASRKVSELSSSLNAQITIATDRVTQVNNAARQTNEAANQALKDAAEARDALNIVKSNPNLNPSELQVTARNALKEYLQSETNKRDLTQFLLSNSLAKAVLAFDSTDCPSGWSAISALAGRFVLGAGRPSGYVICEWLPRRRV